MRKFSPADHRMYPTIYDWVENSAIIHEPPDGVFVAGSTGADLYTRFDKILSWTRPLSYEQANLLCMMIRLIDLEMGLDAANLKILFGGVS